jgi:hypothetical protein
MSLLLFIIIIIKEVKSRPKNQPGAGAASSMSVDINALRPHKDHQLG